MKVKEFIEVLQTLPQNYEIAVFAANAIPRPPTVEPVQANAYQKNTRSSGCLKDPKRAFLIRPEKEIIR